MRKAMTFILLGVLLQAGTEVLGMTHMPRPAYFAFGRGTVDAVQNGADPNYVHDSTSALQKAMNAAIGGTLFIPAGHYRVTGQLTYTSASGLEIKCANGAFLEGDPGDKPIIRTSGAAANLVIDGNCHVANTHNPVSGEGLNNFAVYMDTCQHCSIDHLTITSGRGVEVYNESNYINVTNLSCRHVYDWCYGAATSRIAPTHLVLDGMTAVDTITSHLHGPPDVVNVEGAVDATFTNINIQDGSGITEAGASCFQLYAGRVGVNIQNATLSNITCRKSPSGGFNGINLAAKPGTKLVNVSVTNATIEGYNYCVSGGDGNDPGALVAVKVDVVCNNPQIYGLYFGSNTPGAQDLTIHATVRGPGNVPGALDGIRINRMSGITVHAEISNMGRHGFFGMGLQNSTLKLNTVNNGKSATGDGVRLATFTNGSVPSTGNRIELNSSEDGSSGGPRQRYGLSLDERAAGNSVVSFKASGNAAGAVNDASRSIIGHVPSH